jgi:hypothetical protein
MGLLIFLLGLSSADATYPVSAATYLMCCTEHAGNADIDRALLPGGKLSESTHMDRHRGLMHPICQIIPDPPSIFMNTSHPGSRQPPAPSLAPSESTRMPASVKTKPSLQSLTSSEDHTAVSSHADMGSWYLPGYPQVDARQKMPPGSTEVGGKSELPMHFIPASRLRKRKRRSCSDMVWGTMVSAGRAIVSVFKTESGPPLADKL